MVKKPDEVVAILKEEYGITTMEELCKAISGLGTIDLSPFCAEIITEKEKAS